MIRFLPIRAGVGAGGLHEVPAPGGLFERKLLKIGG